MAQPKPVESTRPEYHEPAEPAPVLTPEESRQGVISGRVFMILAASLLLAAVAFVLVYSAEIV